MAGEGHPYGTQANRKDLPDSMNLRSGPKAKTNNARPGPRGWGQMVVAKPATKSQKSKMLINSDSGMTFHKRSGSEGWGENYNICLNTSGMLI